MPGRLRFFFADAGAGAGGWPEEEASAASPDAGAIRDEEELSRTASSEVMLDPATHCPIGVLAGKALQLF